MAASRKACMCCTDLKSKFFSLNSKKCENFNVKSNLQLLLNEKMDFIGIIDSVVCDHCIHLLGKFTAIRDNVRQRIAGNLVDSCVTPKQNNKRVAKTPPSTLKRQSVVESLITSVEKLKMNATSSTYTNSTSGKVSRRRIHFDHAYTKPDIEETVDLRNDDIIQSIINERLDSKYTSMCREIDQQLSQIANTQTMLLKKSADTLKNSDVFSACVLEMNKQCPALLRYHADNKLMHRLNQVHITMSDSSKRNIVKEFGSGLEDNLIKDISMGHLGKLNGDNLDIRVNTNDIRITNKNTDYHFFASNFVIDRLKVPSASVSLSEPILKECETPYVQCFLPNANELQIYKTSLKVLLAKVMSDHMDGFAWMKKITPNHIDQEYEKEMALKSTIHLLPLSLNNECSYDGCVHIMDEYVEMINRWHRKAGRGCELDSLQIPVGGDQLTRVRFQGAKSLRAGAHTKQERFDQLHPIVIELFHTLQDFLEKLCKRFLDLGNSRDQGTLSHLRMLIQRSNVNGNVKSRFKAHEDFIMTVGHSYFLDFILHKFKMKDLEDLPVHTLIPQNIKLLHEKSKKEIYDAIMEEVIADIFIPYDTQGPQKMDITLKIANHIYPLSATLDNNTAMVPIMIDDKETILQVPVPSVKEGCNVCLNNIAIFIKEATSVKGNDDLYNYAHNFLQWYFVILQMQDAIHEGDITRTNIILKTMIPFFYSHSTLSKYFTECVDYILKTELTLPPHVALRVRAVSFVNVHGGIGKNKAADMHKENEVKLIKDLIKGLGANKTEHSIIKISKAAPVISDVASNFDKMLNLNIFKTKHKKRSSQEDICALVNSLRNLDIWKYHENRVFVSSKGVSYSPFNFENEVFFRHLQSTVLRLKRDLPCESVNGTDDENESESDNETSLL